MMKNKRQRIVLIITENCNLQCDYCYMKRTNRVMSKSIIDKIFIFAEKEYLKKEVPVSFALFGGEPTLEKDLIYYILKKIEDITPKYPKNSISATIFSNGILWDEEFLSKLKQYKSWAMQVSYDGYYSQDESRIDVTGATHADKIIENIFLFKKIFGKFPNIKSMISPTNHNMLIKSMQYYKEHNINKVSFGLVRDDIWSEKEVDDFRKTLTKVQEYMLQNWSKEVLYPNFFYPLFDDNRPHSGLYCGIGNTHIAIGVDGVIFPCQRLIHQDKDFSIGNVNIKDFWDKNQWYNLFKFADFKMLVHCQSCKKFKNACTGTCAVSAYESSGSFFGIIPSVCTIWKDMYNIAIKIQKEKGDTKEFKDMAKQYNYVEKDDNFVFLNK